ncbi:MAG: OmpA family protein [Bdellovibrionia bacterium]
MARRKHEEEHENHERWLVSYADFITLLFAFFTVLYATSQKDISKAKEFEESVRRAFSSFVDFGGVQGDHVAFDINNKLIPPPIDLFPPDGAGPTEVQDAIERLLEKAVTEEERKEMIASIRHDAVGVHVSLAAGALFPSGSDELLAEGFHALSKVANILRVSNRKLVIEGHTDNIPIKGARFRSNWDLAAARATKIVRYLIAKEGIPANRLVAVSYADQKPIAANDTEEGRAKNRRIDVLVVTGQSPF